jgi:cell division septum initiation protein DivIVA
MADEAGQPAEMPVEVQVDEAASLAARLLAAEEENKNLRQRLKKAKRQIAELERRLETPAIHKPQPEMKELLEQVRPSSRVTFSADVPRKTTRNQ